MNKLKEKIHKSKKSIIILICGMPGTRKSSTATQLGALIGFSVIVGMDEVRDIMKLYDKRPIICGVSHDRWKLFGPLNKHNFLKGFFGHSRALRKGALAVIKKNISIGENVIVEGVHLVPSLYRNISGAKVFHILLIAKNFSHHRELLAYKFGRRHKIQKPWNDKHVRHIEQVQKLLVADAKKNNIFILESKNPKNNCQKIVNYLKKNL